MKNKIPEVIEGWSEDDFGEDDIEIESIYQSKNPHHDFQCLTCPEKDPVHLFKFIDEGEEQEDIDDEIAESFSSLSYIAYQLNHLRKYIPKDSEYAKYFYHDFWDMFKRIDDNL